MLIYSAVWRAAGVSWYACRAQKELKYILRGSQKNLKAGARWYFTLFSPPLMPQWSLNHYIVAVWLSCTQLHGYVTYGKAKLRLLCSSWKSFSTCLFCSSLYCVIYNLKYEPKCLLEIYFSCKVVWNSSYQSLEIEAITPMLSQAHPSRSMNYAFNIWVNSSHGYIWDYHKRSFTTLATYKGTFPSVLP